MDLNKLKLLGLTNGEIKVYKVLLENGQSNITTIHQKTNLQRRGIYDIINRLIEKGLISFSIENKKRVFQCAPVEKIQAEAKRKQEELGEVLELIPEIKKLNNMSKEGVKSETFRGREGMKTVFEDMLNYKDAYIIGGGFYLIHKLPYFWPNFDNRRVEKKITWHNLVRLDLKEKIPKTKYLNVKILPKEFSKSPIVIVIYGDKVVHLYWLEEFFAFIIHSKDMAEHYMEYHKLLWNDIAMDP